MAYLQSLSAQLLLWCKSVGFGFLLGFSMDILRLFRALTGGRGRRYVWDLGYTLAAAAATFLYLLAVNAGKVRFFLLAGLAAGFCVWFFGAGRIFRRGTDRMLLLYNRFACAVRMRLTPIFRMPERMSLHIRFFLKKVVKKSKIVRLSMM